MLPTSKAGEAGVTWADPDAIRMQVRQELSQPPGRPTRLQDDERDGDVRFPVGEASARAAAAPSGTAQERAEQTLPTEDTLRAILKTAPLICGFTARQTRR